MAKISVRRILFAALCVCIACVPLFAAGCSDERTELEEQLAALTERNEQLREENAALEDDNARLIELYEELRDEALPLREEYGVSEEQLSGLLDKVDKLIGVDWLSDYSLIGLYVYVDPACGGTALQPVDFLPVEASAAQFTSVRDGYLCYRLTLEEPGLEELIYSVIQLYGMDFVAYADLIYFASGAGSGEGEVVL